MPKRKRVTPKGSLKDAPKPATVISNVKSPVAVAQSPVDFFRSYGGAFANGSDGTGGTAKHTKKGVGVAEVSKKEENEEEAEAMDSDEGDEEVGTADDHEVEEKGAAKEEEGEQEGDEGEGEEEEGGEGDEDAAVHAALFGEDEDDGEGDSSDEGDEYDDGEEGDEGPLAMAARMTPAELELYGPLLEKALEEVDDIDNGGFQIGGDGKGNHWAGRTVKLDDDDTPPTVVHRLGAGEGGDFAAGALASLQRLVAEDPAQVAQRLTALGSTHRQQLGALMQVLLPLDWGMANDASEGSGDEVTEETDEEEAVEEEEEEKEEDEGPEEVIIAKHKVDGVDGDDVDADEGDQGDDGGEGEGDEEGYGEGDEGEGDMEEEEEEWAPRTRTKAQRIAYDNEHLGRLKELYGPIIEKHLEEVEEIDEGGQKLEDGASNQWQGKKMLL